MTEAVSEFVLFKGVHKDTATIVLEGQSQGIVNIQFSPAAGANKLCAAVDVQNKVGTAVRNEIYCGPGAAVVSVDV